MNLDAVNPELESKINNLVCETYNKPFLEQEKLLKEAIWAKYQASNSMGASNDNGYDCFVWVVYKIKNMNRLRNGWVLL